MARNKNAKDECVLSKMQLNRHFLNKYSRKGLYIENIENNVPVLLNYCQIG